VGLWSRIGVTAVVAAAAAVGSWQGIEAAGAGQAAAVAVATIAATSLVTLGGVWASRVRGTDGPMPPPGNVPEGGSPGGSSHDGGVPPSFADQGSVVSVPIDRLPAEVRGREVILRELQQQFRLGGLAVLTGTGGMGKSTVARELVRRMSAKRKGLSDSLIWEVSGVSVTSLTAGLITVARQLGASEAELQAIAGPAPAGPDRLWELLTRAPKGWLLIIDNADSPEILAAPMVAGADSAPKLRDGTGWARVNRRGLVLVSSRQREEAFWPGQAVLYPVTKLTQEEAAKVLLDLAPAAGNEAQARALGHRLGGLPLVLYLAGRYLGSEYVADASFAGYLGALNSDPRALKLMEPDPGDPERVERAMVMLTWELSLNALADAGLPQARPLLRMLSCFEPALPIPISLLRHDLLDPLLHDSADLARGPETSDVRPDQVLRGLSRLGLIDSAPLSDKQTMSILGQQDDTPDRPGQQSAILVHPAIADTNRIYLLEPGPSDPAESLVRQTAVTLLVAVLDKLIEDRPGDWPAFRLLSPHLQALLANSASRLDEDHLDTLVRVTGHAAEAYGQMRSPEFGIELIDLALSIAHRRAMGQTQTILIAQQQLAMLLRQVGAAADAEAIYREVLDAQLRIWPADDPGNLAIRHNLAGVISAQPNRRDEAEAALQDLLKDEQRVLGPDDPNTLSTRQQLATLWCFQDRWAEAEAALKNLLQDQRRVFGPDDRATLATRHNLAQAIRLQGREEEARPAFRDILKDASRLLGPDHFLTVTTRQYRDGGFLGMSLLSTPHLREQLAASLLEKADGLADQEHLDDAVAAYRELLDRFADDPDPVLRELTAIASFNQAITLRKMQHYEEALPPAERAEAAYRQLAETTPDRYQDRLSSARRLTTQIKADLAKPLLEKAGGLADQEHLDDAVAAYRELLDRFADDPDPVLRELTAIASFNQAITLRKMEQHEGALAAAERAEAAYRQLADTTPDRYQDRLSSARRLTTQIKADLAKPLLEKAGGLADQEHLDDAVAAYRELLDRFADDPDPVLRELTAIASFNQAITLRKMEQHEGALAAAERAEAAYRQLADTTPDRYQDRLSSARRLTTQIKADLATSLYIKGVALRKTHHYDEALAAAERAEAAYRQLAGTTPDRHQDDLDSARLLATQIKVDLATSLFDIAEGLLSQERLADAVPAYRELLDRFADDPTPALHQLIAMAFFDLGTALSQLRNGDDAVTAYQELLDRFADDPSPGLRQPTAAALFNQSAILTTGQRYAEALPPAERAEAAYRQLAEASPDRYHDDLAEARQLLEYLRTELGQGRAEPPVGLATTTQ